MKIAESRLRSIIREQILFLLSEETPTPGGASGVNTGKEIKDTSTSKKASEKVTLNPAIMSALDAIKDPQGLAAFLQDITNAVTEKNMDQEKMRAGVKKFGQAVLSAKKP